LLLELGQLGLSGVPQGSVLGPVLFVCYVNDMPELVKSLIYLYANDAKIARAIETDSDVVVLQQDLDALDEWTNDWQMKFNATKCKHMRVGNRNRIESSYSVGQNSSKMLDIIDEEKDLGIWTDSELKSSRHISHAVAKSNQMLGLIKRSFVHKDNQSMKLLYTALVRPHLECGQWCGILHIRKINIC